ncbi:MAG: Fic family protein [Verrucomicrobia bacterium]|nr:Fic family protein [Verrucomicrobiota bacterium]MDA1065053.1 Fic family protein [Verrucomicrobiota bacterium]
MPYEPLFSITSQLLSLVEEIAALRERIQGATVELSWIPALQKDTRTRNVHASTAIEGNPLTLTQVRALEEGRELTATDSRSRREVLNYFVGLRFVENQANIKKIRHEELFELHRILADGVMDQGDAGTYRTIGVRVGKHMPPAAAEVSGLMFELLEWWNTRSTKLSPVLSSAILHHRFETIHPFADGNGRTGRALALWELYRRGFDSHHIFSVDEYYWENRPAYYSALDAPRKSGEDLSGWLEYSAEGIRQTLVKVWLRVQAFNIQSQEKLVLRPRQEQLLNLLRDHGSLAPAELWEALAVSRQGAMNLLRPLIDAGIVEKIGGKKTGRYALKQTNSDLTS